MLEFSVPYNILWHFVIAALFIFSAITGIVGLYSKEKSFKFYSGYSLFLMLYLFLKSPYEIHLVEAIYQSRWRSLNWFLQSIYYTLYFFFFLYFLNINVYFNQLYRRFKVLLNIFLIISSVFFLLSLIYNSISVYEAFYFYTYIPITFIMGLYVLYKASKTPGNLKYFFIGGSSIYLVSAFFAFFLSIAHVNLENHPAWFIVLIKHGGLFYFFIGILIEHMIFALGLAYRIKEINAKVISSLKEKEELKIQLNLKLEKELIKKEKEVKQLTKKAEREKLLKIKSEFESEINKLHLTSLHSQMNPHFIFNALNSIKVFLIENKKEEAIYYLNKFAKLIRTILEASRTEVINLEEELKIIELYIGIERIRQPEKFSLKIETDSQVDLSNIKVPPLILQPFIENAIWHGFSKKKGRKTILIKTFFNKNNQPELFIEDNGVGRRMSEELKSERLFKKESLGLQITKERLEFFNERENKSYSFLIKDLKTKEGIANGTRVCFYFGKKPTSYFSAG